MIKTIPPVYGQVHEYYLMYPGMERDHRAGKIPTMYNSIVFQVQSG